MRRALLLSLVILTCASTALSVGTATERRDADRAPNVRALATDLGSVSGIAYDGEALWITRDGAPVVHRVDPDSGRVIRSLAFVTPDTGGSAWDGRTLWQIAYVEKMVYAIDPATGRATPAFRTPGSGMCAGMTYDGRHLWIANFEDSRIYRVDRRGHVVDSMPGSPETTGLAWDGRHLWTGILAGTKSHDEVTPYSGFVQQLAAPERAPLRVWAVPGVGPGASDWIPGRRHATRFWWYDGFNKRIVQMNVPPASVTPPAVASAAALFAIVLAFMEVTARRDRAAASIRSIALTHRARV